METLLSIIIPQKNSAKLVRRCLNSIPKDDYIQIIVVDDNSSKPEELRALESDVDFPNIEFVYTTEGRGAGYARNVGLQHAQSEWLLFSDADDFFDELAFDTIKNYLRSEFDMVVFKHRSENSETGEATVRSNSRNNYIDSYLNGDSLQMNKIRYCNDVPWAKLIRRKLVLDNNIVFDEVPASNDTMFSLMCGHYSQKIHVDPTVIYVVTVQEGSITKTKSIERYYSDHCVALRKNQFVRSIGHPECQEIIFSRIAIVARTFGLKQMIRFLKEVKKYDGKLFYGLSAKIGIR